MKVTLQRSDGYQVITNELDRLPSFADVQGAAQPGMIRMATRLSIKFEDTKEEGKEVNLSEEYANFAQLPSFGSREFN